MTLPLIWMSSMTVLVWPHGVKYAHTWYKGEARDARLTSTGRMRKKVVFSPSPLPLDYKTVAHLILRAKPPHLPSCSSHKYLIFITLFHAYHFVSCWIHSVPRHKEPAPLRSDTRWVILIKKKKKKGFKSQSGFWLGSSQRYFWIARPRHRHTLLGPVWGQAGP